LTVLRVGESPPFPVLIRRGLAIKLPHGLNYLDRMSRIDLVALRWKSLSVVRCLLINIHIIAYAD